MIFSSTEENRDGIIFSSTEENRDGIIYFTWVGGYRNIGPMTRDRRHKQHNVNTVKHALTPLNRFA